MSSNKETKKKNHDLPECVINCKYANGICPIVKSVLKLSDDFNIAEFDLNETLKKFVDFLKSQQEIEKEIKKTITESKSIAQEIKADKVKFDKDIDENIRAIEREKDEFNKQKEKDKQYTWARTFQIGLLTIAEALRIQRTVFLKPRVAIGMADFDEYGIDKYFGMKYTNDIKYIMEIKEDCRDYDRLLVNNEDLEKKVRERLGIDKLEDHNKDTLEELAEKIRKSSTDINNPIVSHLDAIFEQIDSIDVIEFREAEVKEIKEIFSANREKISDIKPAELQQMLKFFGNIIHKIIERKIS